MLILSAAMLMAATPVFESFEAPGYDAPVWGVRYAPGEAAAGIPLGALGTGYVELRPDGRFGKITCENDWLRPRAVAPESGFTFRAGERTLDLTAAAQGSEAPIRFWGHWPAADLDFQDALGPVRLYLRAYAPAVPHDYRSSALPVVLFRIVAANSGTEETPVELHLAWARPDAVDGSDASAEAAETAPPGRAPEPNGATVLLPAQDGAYALGGTGDGWAWRTERVSSGPCAVAAARTLAPGETAEAVMALAWHFPEWTSSDGEVLRHRYAADPGRTVEHTLHDGLARARDLETGVVAWQEKVYAADVPPALKDACINGLYVLAKNSWWMDDGRFLQSESFTGCPITETFVCRFYGSFPLALLWPELEKSSMAEMARHQGTNGQIPFGLGQPLGSRTPMMDLQVPIVSTEFALTAWRNYALWRDEDYLVQAYPAVKRALEFAATLDTDGDGLVNEAPGSEEGFPANQYYDIWPWWGTSAYVGGISLAAWRAGEEMARRRGDSEFAATLRDRFARGSRAYEEKLWTGAYYRLYSGDAKHPASDTSLTNALCGPWYAYATGLGDLLPRDRVASVIDTVFRLNAAATAYGAVNGVRPDGAVDTSFHDHSAVITIGEVWNFCALAAFHGHRKEDALRLFDRSYGNVALRQKTPWSIPWSLDRDTGAIKWGIDYYSNPCVWTLFQALAPEAWRSLGPGAG